jgi:hypothetical protein
VNRKEKTRKEKKRKEKNQQMLQCNILVERNVIKVTDAKYGGH